MTRSFAMIASTLLLGSCASSHGSEPWVYGISRCAYSDMMDHSKWSTQKTEPQASEFAYAIVLVFPFALDTVLLPITIPHDLAFVK